MKHFKITLLAITTPLFFLILSCDSNNDEITINKEILGEYKFVSYTSTIPLDLNFDTVKNNNLLIEFTYWNNRSQKDARIWEYHNADDYLPYYIQLNNFPRVGPTAINLSSRLNVNTDAVAFRIDENLKILDSELILTNYPESGKYFYTTNFEILPNKILKVNGRQEFYDYQTDEWVEVEVEAFLEKM